MTNNWPSPLVRVIDVAEGDFPPVVVIPAPAELTDNEQLKATLRCDAPYDIDDDSSDDTATALYTKSSQPIVESSEIVVTLLVAALLLIVAYLGGILTSTPTAKKKSAPQVKETPKSERSSVTPLLVNPPYSGSAAETCHCSCEIRHGKRAHGQAHPVAAVFSLGRAPDSYRRRTSVCSQS